MAAAPGNRKEIVMIIPLSRINLLDQIGFTEVCGPLFEHSPWIAERAWVRRPFASVEQLHQTLCEAMYGATEEEQIKLISSHPDLVGRLAKQGRLTAESTAEQSAAGLIGLSPEDVDAFDRYNADYKSRFGFPFVICARKNKKDAILQAFPVRLQNSREQEIKAALAEIAKIARLRLHDVVSDE